MKEAILKEQSGVSAQKAIEYMSPIIERVLENQNTPGAKAKFGEDLKASLSAMPHDDILILGHRLDVLNELTQLMLAIVGSIALAGLIKDELGVHPSLS